MNIKELVCKFDTKHKAGFTTQEIEQLLSNLEIDKELFYNKLGIQTSILMEGDSITFKDDVELGIRCVLENREPNAFEWD